MSATTKANRIELKISAAVFGPKATEFDVTIEGGRMTCAAFVARPNSICEVGLLVVEKSDAWGIVFAAAVAELTSRVLAAEGK